MTENKFIDSRYYPIFVFAGVIACVLIFFATLILSPFSNSDNEVIVNSYIVDHEENLPLAQGEISHNYAGENYIREVQEVWDSDRPLLSDFAMGQVGRNSTHFKYDVLRYGEATPIEYWASPSDAHIVYIVAIYSPHLNYDEAATVWISQYVNVGLHYLPSFGSAPIAAGIDGRLLLSALNAWDSNFVTHEDDWTFLWVTSVLEGVDTSYLLDIGDDNWLGIDLREMNFWDARSVAQMRYLDNGYGYPTDWLRQSPYAERLALPVSIPNAPPNRAGKELDISNPVFDKVNFNALVRVNKLPASSIEENYTVFGIGSSAQQGYFYAWEWGAWLQEVSHEQVIHYEQIREQFDQCIFEAVENGQFVSVEEFSTLRNLR